MTIFHSPFPDITLPKTSLPQFLLDRPMPDRPYITDAVTGRTHTFPQMKDLAGKFARGLVDNLGWKHGQVLCCFSPNNIDFPAVVFGTLLAGGTISPANPAYGKDELVHQLKDSRSRALVCHPDLLSVALPAAQQVGIPREAIFVFSQEREVQGIPSWQSNLASSPLDFSRAKQINPEKDLAYLVYSSGTTGLPKGVMLSHSNLTANISQNAAVDGQHFNKDSCMAGVLPFYHIFGLTCIMQQTFFKQIRLVVHAHFDLERLLKSIQEYRITFAHLVPPIILRLAKDEIVSKYDLSSLQMINSGAAPLAASLAREAADRCKTKVKQGYGLSETSPTSNTTPWDKWDTLQGSVGPLVPNLLAKIVSDDEKELDYEQDGEIWFKGPSVMQGYLNNAKATENSITPDGWFKTGDIGHFDKEGNLYITDRVKELIKFKGFQVPPAELEGVLLTHKDVIDCGVVGVEDPSQATELPRAYVVVREGVKTSEALAKDIAAHVASKVAKHKQLRGGVLFIPEIPKSPSGKILRRVLRDRKDPLAPKARL
ncbi:hypothetical protein PYCC9005_004886 [Savitreella phatthalungensis]